MAQANTFNESEMALCSEPTDQSAQKVLDGADIVRDAMFRHCYGIHRIALSAPKSYPSSELLNVTRVRGTSNA